MMKRRIIGRKTACKNVEKKDNREKTAGKNDEKKDNREKNCW